MRLDTIGKGELECLSNGARMTGKLLVKSNSVADDVRN